MAPGRYPRLAEKSEAVLVTKGAKKEIRFLVSRRAAPAILSAATTLPEESWTGCANAFESIFELLIVNCESARSNLRKFGLKLQASRDGVTGISPQAMLPHDHVDLFLRKVGKNRLPKRRAMNWGLTAYRYVHAQRMPAICNSDGDHVTIAENSEGRCFPGLATKFFEIRTTNCCQVKSRYRSRLLTATSAPYPK